MDAAYNNVWYTSSTAAGIRAGIRTYYAYLPLLREGIILLEALAGHLLGESRHARESALPPDGLVVLIALLFYLRNTRCVPHGLFGLFDLSAVHQNISAFLEAKQHLFPPR